MPSFDGRVKELFIAALDRPPEERKGFLASVCADHDAVRLEVESLLAAHDEDDPLASEPSPTSSPTEPFSPGEVFASRYRMVTCSASRSRSS